MGYDKSELIKSGLTKSRLRESELIKSGLTKSRLRESGLSETWW